MPKATLTFNLPEEREEHQIALNGSKYYRVITAVLGSIRQQIKYENLTDAQIKVLEDIRNLINEEME